MVRKICITSLLYIMCAMLASCTTFGGHRVESGEGMRQKTWADFQENRPYPKYIRSRSHAITELCADITDVYILTTDLLDKAAIRAENCEVACKLEVVRRELGEEAYLEAVSALTDEEWHSFRAYEYNEVSDLALAHVLWSKACTFTWHISDLVYEFNRRVYEYGWVEGISVGIEAARVIPAMEEQVAYTLETLAWLKEYQRLLERAHNYQGR